ncbi:phage holin [Listeria costaricensis]|uniref:phage holin n=1 Tax=Listeria costaricensis TaxID=2026604 RepID=UPI000C06AB1B|nr:phage holin [Listeria costaricensis]
MKINWKVRFKNKVWIVAMIATLFFIIQSSLIVFGINWDYSNLLEQMITIITGIFALIGLIIDPTTANTSDSRQALDYEKPKGDEK